MNPQKIVLETRFLLARVETHAILRACLIVLAALALIPILRYVWQRWTYIPRKRQRKFFRERLDDWPTK